MKKLNLIDLIKVDAYSITSKYLQIVNSVIREIQNGNFTIDDPLPSINELSIELDIARDTVERGYRHLKNLGIIHAVPRRGYFIKNNKFTQALKIFLLFNKLSAHKKTIYDSFVSSLGEHAIIDFYIYNNDFLLFKKLLSMRKEDYTNYVIIPHFIEGVENAYEIINTLPKEKLLLLDKIVPGVSGEYAAAYENFEKDIYNALYEAMDALSKYHTLKIIFPKDSYYPPGNCEGLH
jgi:DNA-binding transcriptional regulator YhcF (GntR family)